jgi:hypothetical protein
LQPDATIADAAVAEQLLPLGVEHVIMTRGDKGVL